MDTQASAALVVVVALVLLALALALFVLLALALTLLVLLALAFAALVFLAVGHGKTPVLEWEKNGHREAAATSGACMDIAVDIRSLLLVVSSSPEDQPACARRVEAAVTFLRLFSGSFLHGSSCSG
jgi:hypothetical protein